MRRSRQAQRLLLTGVAIAVMGLLFAASAGASRRPTRNERRAITRVAKRSPHAGSQKVHVSHIRVSTVGPWASARVTIFVDRQADSATDVLRKVRGRWRLTKHSPGTVGEWCGIGMPRKDQRNLGFGSCRGV